MLWWLGIVVLMVDGVLMAGCGSSIVVGEQCNSSGEHLLVTESW